MLFFTMFFPLSLSMYFDVLLFFCLFLWHVNPTLFPSSVPLTPHFSVTAFMKNTILFCHFIFPLTQNFMVLTLNHPFQSVTFYPALPIPAPSHPIAPSSLFSHLLLLLLRTGPVCTGRDSQSGDRVGQAEGKSSSSLGGTSSWQGLRPPCFPAVSTVPSPQQLNQGNTAPTL